MQASKRFLFPLLFVFALVASGTGCDKAKEQLMGPLKDQAMALVKEHSGKLTNLSGVIGPMLSKLGSIPDSIPGAKALKEKLGGASGKITAVQGLLSAAPAKIEEAVKSKDKDKIMGLIDELKGAGDTIKEVEGVVTESKDEFAAVEKAAAEAPAEGDAAEGDTAEGDTAEGDTAEGGEAAKEEAAEEK